MNRQKQVLLSLVGLLLLAILYAYWMMPVQQRVADSSNPVGSNTASATADVRPPDKNRLRIDLLEKDPAGYKGYKRDLFNFYVPKPVPQKAPPVKKPIERPIIKPQPPAVTPIVRQQLARFTFLGFLEKDEVRTVFLSRDDDLFLVQENDQFGDDRQFTAVSIASDKLTIRQAGDSRHIEIQLVEKEPLIPTMQAADEPPPRPIAPLPVAPPPAPGTPPPLMK